MMANSDSGNEDTPISLMEITKKWSWVYDKQNNKMIQREIEFVPGLYNIFNEILLNAADNKQRDKNMNTIKIDISQEKNTITIWNNGQGMPVVMHMHNEKTMLAPSMIFGHLLNLCKCFSMETAAQQYNKIFKLVSKGNVIQIIEPEKFVGQDFTKITFSPDLSKFKMEKLDDDIVVLMSHRALEIAASTRGVSVFLNGEELPVKQFRDYIDLYIKDKTDECGGPLKIVYENINEQWEVAATISEKGFQQVSFVNSIATTKGGCHIDFIVDIIIKQLIEHFRKKNQYGVETEPCQVKNRLWVFINCYIENPTFDSPTNEKMVNKFFNIGKKRVISHKFILELSRLGILAEAADKKITKILDLTILSDANNAGSENSTTCTLIITEGDAAKTLAVFGLRVLGRDNYGILSLNLGKLVNVREASNTKILENSEFNHLTKALGLEYEKKYITTDDLKTLRYSRMMIMTEQDPYGAYFMGLIINFIHAKWPELLRFPIIEQFVIPMVKVTYEQKEFSFYSLNDFEKWKKSSLSSNFCSVNYYKGLGVSSSKEAEKYFADIASHRILFKYNEREDSKAIEMAFKKRCVGGRKEVLTKFMDNWKQSKILCPFQRYLYTKTTKEFSFRDFINQELVLYWHLDNTRVIPSAVDGLKPDQRKVLFTCIKRNDMCLVNVAQLAGSVAETSAYHHGEHALFWAIGKLAQNFIGTNNINLLISNRQFGTRLRGGKDISKPVYLCTMMSPLTRFIFHPHDDPLLEYFKDNEPSWFVPIIPMVLVNGSEGIGGAGWSTKIPNHNPRDIISNLRRMIVDKEPLPLAPWYKHFKGSIQPDAKDHYVTVGNISILGENKIEITELPIGVWTENYLEDTLEPLLKCNGMIIDYKTYYTDTTVRFVITLHPDAFHKLEREDCGFHHLFKLTSPICLTYMNAFDSDNCIRHYQNVNVILKEFFKLRMKYYHIRKEYRQGMLQAEISFLDNQAKFIAYKLRLIKNKKDTILIDKLVQLGYDPDPIVTYAEKMKTPKDGNPGECSKTPVDVKKYKYLSEMPVEMFTTEKKNELLKQRDSKTAELNVLIAKTAGDLWMDDLEALEKKLKELEDKEKNDELEIPSKSEIFPTSNSVPILYNQP